jgi:hypothetical protein
VPKREGRIRELPIREGNDVLDNNILACSKQHWQKVIYMLRTQRRVRFTGGLEASRISDWVVRDLQSVSLDYLFVAYDRIEQRRALVDAAKRLSGLTRRKKCCFVLIGRGPIDESISRILDCWHLGYFPFAMLYQPPEGDRIEYDEDWKKLQRAFCRPALTKTLMRDGWNGDLSVIRPRGDFGRAKKEKTNATS